MIKLVEWAQFTLFQFGSEVVPNIFVTFDDASSSGSGTFHNNEKLTGDWPDLTQLFSTAANKMTQIVLAALIRGLNWQIWPL